MITVYHNSRCGKSRDCVAFLENKNQEIEIVKYLETPLSFDELSILLAKLKCQSIGF
jgi:arsenate reductase